MARKRVVEVNWLHTEKSYSAIRIELLVVALKFEPTGMYPFFSLFTSLVKACKSIGWIPLICPM